MNTEARRHRGFLLVEHRGSEAQRLFGEKKVKIDSFAEKKLYSIFLTFKI